jgi:hypothetical protein
MANRRPTGEPLESRVVPATITWDGGAGTFNWQDPLNWDSNSLPTASDDAVIGDLTGAPTISVGASVSINSLISAESPSAAERSTCEAPTARPA